MHWQRDSSNKVPAMNKVLMYKQKMFDNTVASPCNDNNEFGITQLRSSSEIKTQFPRLSNLALGIWPHLLQAVPVNVLLVLLETLLPKSEISCLRLV